MSIHILEYDAIPKAVDICVKSFIDKDSLIHDTYGNSSHKEELVRHLYTNYFTQTNSFKHHIFYSSLPESEDYASHVSNMQSVALALPPNTPWPNDLWEIFAVEHRQLIKKIGNELVAIRFDKLEGWFDEQRAALHQENAYYLVLLATDPTSRKKGYASRLVKHLTDMADNNGAPVFLECSEPENLPYYEAKGFKIINTATIPRSEKEDPSCFNHNSAPTIWYMVRNPKPK